MQVGFTGTRRGMTQAQLRVFAFVALDYRTAELFVHGDCVGADVQAHDVMKGIGLRVRARPCTIEKMRAFCDADEVMEPKYPLERNRDIVMDVDLLFATPGGPEHGRSGTWATVRYARAAGKKIMIVWPDGQVTEEG